MRLLESFLIQRKLVLTLALMLALLGLLAWNTMIRQEDPDMPRYWGQVVVAFPGADAETVERLVVEPLEDELSSVDEIKMIESSSSAEVAVLEIELRDTIDDSIAAWDEVREALDDAHAQLPAGVTKPTLSDDLNNQESIVYALTGAADPLVLAAAAEELRDEILGVSGVSQVNFIADPGETIFVELDEAAARRLNLSPRHLAAQLLARNQVLPGGSVELAGRAVSLRPRSDFRSVEEIAATPVQLPSGESVPLAAIARVRRGPKEPIAARMRWNGEESVGLGVERRRGVNVVAMGEAVRRRVAEVAPRLAPVQVREIIYQPAQVEERLDNLSRSLVLGMLVVAGVLILAMGLRLGFVVASVVPLVALSSLAVYAMGGGILHQMSIAALVIALGMLVDNAVVVAEGVQWRIDRGEPRAEAAVGAVRELAIPLAGATLTTVAAFLPMWMATGPTADFTRAIPVVIILTLTLSYLFALLVTPTLSRSLLRPRKENPRRGRVAQAIGRLTVEHPGRVLVVALLVVGLSGFGAGFVRRQFFPNSDREQLVVELKLPEGTHLEATDRLARQVERTLMEKPGVTGVGAFVGRGLPKFYYNLPNIPWSPHMAQLVVETTGIDQLDPLMAWLRRYAEAELPQVELVARKLEQGPPVVAPIELRLYGRGLGDLHTAAEQVLAQLKATPGTEDVRHNLSVGTPVLELAIDDAAAARRGLARADVATSLYGRTRGLPAGFYRGADRVGDDLVPVLVRSSAGEYLELGELPQINVAPPGGEPVPLAQVATTELEWRPAQIRHRHRRRVAMVLSELASDATYSDVLRDLEPRLARLEFPPGVRLEIGGAAESSGEANSAMLGALPIGVLLLLGVLMAEFRSFRRVGIVLSTVPLAAAGVVPGLLLSGEPFGFMSLLGVIALVGVVVNNAIVLLEVVESRRNEGADVSQALKDAVERRLRPILLATTTTVAGLLPLAFSGSTMWPPMAWALISGLLASTLLTLLVVPALYRLLFEPRCVLPGAVARWVGRRRELATAGTILLVIFLAAPVTAQEEPVEYGGEGVVTMSLKEAMERAAVRPRIVAATHRAAGAERLALAARRLARLPTVSVVGAVSDQDRDVVLQTPIGAFEFGSARSEDAQLIVDQPLWNPARRKAGAASTALAQASSSAARRRAEEAAAAAAEAFVDVLSLDARSTATDRFIESLEARREETRARVDAGRVLESDALKVELSLAQARQDRLALEELRFVATLQLGHAVGLDGPVQPRGSENGFRAPGIPGGGRDDLAPPPDPAPPSSPLKHDRATARDPRRTSLAILPRGGISLPTLLERAIDHRADLAALRDEIRALELTRAAVKAEYLPRLTATARWNYSTGSPFDDETWLDGRLAVTWNPFAAATRKPRVQAAQADLEARRADLTEAMRGIELQLRAALAQLATAQGEVLVGETGIAQAEETLRVEQERHAAGRATTNDLLDAEAAVREKRTQRDVARLNVVRASVRLQLAVGGAYFVSPVIP